MKAIRFEKTTAFLVTALPFAAIGLLLLTGGLLGASVASIGGGAGAKTLLIGAAVFAAIAVVVCFVLELPIIAFVRLAFIASFFFKGELNFYKIDEIEDPSGFNLSLTLLTGLILLIYDQFDDREDFREKLFPTAFSILLAALLICAVASVIYGGSTLLGWFSIWSFLTSVLIAAVVASHFSERERLIQLIIGTATGLLFTGAIALSQYTVDFPMNLSFFGTGTEDELLGTQSIAMSRVPAFLRTPTEMAWVVSTLIPIVIAPVICRVKDLSSRNRNTLLIAALAGVVAVILSLARGSWISLLVALMILVMFGWRRLSVNEKRRYFVSVFGVFIFASLLLAPFAGRIYERLTEDDQGSALIRVPLMETAARMIEDNPLVGVGLNGYRSNMTRYDETDIFVSQVFPNPVHNVFAHITAEIGIPGGIVFCLLILVSLIECLKTMTARDRLLFAVALGATAGMIAFVISAIKEPGSLGSVRPPMRTCFFLFGIILAASRLRRQLIF
ncbi:MAG: O-antigen ligase family protein [Acidobacteriota bacterium]|nr:O-antigen ligase family protein [Acidobacteriota bacterium]